MRNDERRKTDEEYQLLADVYCFVIKRKDRLYRKRNNKRKVYIASNVSIIEFFDSIYSIGDVQSSEIRVFKNFEDEYGDDIDALYNSKYGKPCTYRRKYFNMFVHDVNSSSLTDFDVNEITKKIKQNLLLDPSINVIGALTFMRNVNHYHNNGVMRKMKLDIYDK